MTDFEILEYIGLTPYLYGTTRTEVLKAMAQVRKVERDRCAKILNDRAKKCAEKAGLSDDEKDRIDLRAMAWTFSVIEQEIIEGDGK